MKLTIELTGGASCPLNCIHCSSTNHEILTLDTIQKVFQDHDFTDVTLSGGEPFFHPQFEEIARYLLDRGCKVSLNTCGLSRHKVHKYFYAVYDTEGCHPSYFGKSYKYPNIVNKFSEIYVSFYGGRKVHNTITRTPSFEVTLSFYLRARLMMKRGNGRIFINTPVFSRYQINDLIKSISIYDEMEQAYYTRYHISFTPFDDVIHLIRLLPHGRSRNLKVLPREKQLEIALRVKRKFPDQICISESLLHNHCNWESKRTLLSDGRLIHCVAGKHSSDPDQPFVCDYVR